MEPNGLVYMLARYYDPQSGRFLSTDPVEPDPQAGTNFNRYAYADDNPYSKYDPNGREAACVSLNVDCFGNDPDQQARNAAAAEGISEALSFSPLP
jgi:RHS repeat-associated protein